MPGTTVVADMEAGLEHLSWAGGTLRHVDVLVVVTEPHVKSLVTAARTLDLAAQLGIARSALVANRIGDGAFESVTELASERNVEVIAAIPEDPAVRAADRAGACLLDSAPHSPATRAITRLADDLALTG